MLVAVCTLTRDRLSYTKHCFETLRQYAGVDFHHYVLDQDSHDGSDAWLKGEVDEGRIKYLHQSGQNVGIARGMNFLINKALRHGGYDALVKIDNDCELNTPDTLLYCAKTAVELDALVSPIVDGLSDPPLQIGRKVDVPGGGKLRQMSQIGGIFMASPIQFWTHFRYPEDLPKWGHDDTFISQYAINGDMLVGYLEGFRVNHYRTTEGQHHDFPDYFRRRQEEGGPE